MLHSNLILLELTVSKQQTLNFIVKGMSCTSCSSRLERTLGNIPEIQSVTVSLNNSMATVIPIPEANIKKLIQEVISETEKTGFIANYLAEDLAEQKTWILQQESISHYLEELKQRLIIEFFFTILVLFISMGPMWGVPVPVFVNPKTYPLNNAIAQLLLTIPVIWSGRYFYLIGFSRLWKMSPNMDTLVALSTSAAIIYSIWSTIEISFGNYYTEPSLYYETAVVLITLISLGKYFEMLSRFRMSDAISRLMNLVPETALRLSSLSDQEESFEEVPLSNIKVGDIVQVRPGSKVPVDGKILKGSSSINTSMLTGESMPVFVTVGDKVIGGTINLSGMFLMHAEKVGLNTALAHIIRLVREAQGSKALISRITDQISLIFVPVVIAIALVSGLTWLLLGDTSIADSIRIVMTVLVISCPCALGLATPMSIMIATGRGAQLGLLIKSGAALEYAADLDTIVFDKTGTLTEGKPHLIHTVPLKTMPDNELLRITASLEAVSEHPLADAIVRAAHKHGLVLYPVINFMSYPGRGVRGELQVKTESITVLVGNKTFLEEHHISLDNKVGITTLEEFAGQSFISLLVAINGQFSGIIAVTDPIREESNSVTEQLQHMGIRTIMLTGDSKQTAQIVANHLHLNEVIADVMPEGKAYAIQELKNKGFRVGMVGDGINDAPALAKADVGIAIGSGIDIAIETSDIVLLNSLSTNHPLSGVVSALLLSRATLRNIRQNLFWAFGYNIICIPIAAGILKLFGGPLLSPMLAGLAMALSSISVVLNALRLKKFTPS